MEQETTAAPATEETLFAAIGGMEPLERLVDRFYLKARTDPLLREQFRDLPPEHVGRVTLWLAEVFGGPDDYSRRRGGHRALIRAHGGRHITEEQRARWVELMLETARETLAPSPQLHQALADYFEWGTRIASAVSQSPPEDEDPGPMPRWGWNGLE
jgi:hemoglobin